MGRFRFGVYFFRLEKFEGFVKDLVLRFVVVKFVLLFLWVYRGFVVVLGFGVFEFVGVFSLEVRGLVLFSLGRIIV